jgi:predicted esterase
MKWPITLLMLFCFTSGLFAQAERYELGRRLKRFEETWNETKDAELRKKALTDLPKLTQQFFSFQFGEAGKTLENARRILLDKEDNETQRFVDSLYLVPESRLLDADNKVLKLTIKQFYSVVAEEPVEPAISFWWNGGRFANQMKTMTRWPFKWEVPMVDPKEMPENWVMDYPTRSTVGSFKKTHLTTMTISRVKNLEARLKAIKQIKDVPPIELATLKDRADLLNEMAEGFVPETDIPAGKLILEAEAIGKLGQKPYFTHEKSGQFWLSVPTEKNRRTACRLFVPEQLDKSKPVPIVVALHGAGGSENLFFEGYGNGWIVEECKKRGWLLLATRSGLGFGTAPPIPAILDQLQERYPINRQAVFVVGHSMGAGQTIAAAQEYPGQFRAVAALGGGGGVRKKDSFEKLPVFIGVGDKDFALGGARGLNKALAAAGAKAITYKEYPNIEHLVIVREALPDVFNSWDALLK